MRKPAGANVRAVCGAFDGLRTNREIADLSGVPIGEVATILKSLGLAPRASGASIDDFNQPLSKLEEILAENVGLRVRLKQAEDAELLRVPAIHSDAALSRQLLVAYCAGVVDSDGSIGIRKNKNRDKRRPDGDRYTAYVAKVNIGQTEQQAIQVAISLFGGHRKLRRSGHDRWKPLYFWEATNIKAESALREMLPFLKIKKDQALTCLRLRDIIRESKILGAAKGRVGKAFVRRTPYLLAAMEKLFMENKALNTVGFAIDHALDAMQGEQVGGGRVM